MSKYKRVGKWIGIILTVIAIIGGSLYFIYLRPFVQKMKVVNTINYDKELTLVIGGGGNSGILVSDSLVLVIDTKMDEAAKNLHDQVEKLASGKPILVVNTHIHPDHIGGNQLYKDARIMAGGNYTKEHWIKEAGQESLPNAWLKERLDFKMGEETVSIINYAKNAHTESDVFVYLHTRKLLFGGDVILNKQNTIIMGNADPEGYLNAMNYFLNAFEIEYVVPGHGDFGGKEIILNFEQYFKDMKIAANDDSQREILLNKYKDWSAIPVFMSPEATMKSFKKK